MFEKDQAKNYAGRPVSRKRPLWAPKAATHTHTHTQTQRTPIPYLCTRRQRKETSFGLSGLRPRWRECEEESAVPFLFLFSHPLPFLRRLCFFSRNLPLIYDTNNNKVYDGPIKRLRQFPMTDAWEAAPNYGIYLLVGPPFDGPICKVYVRAANNFDVCFVCDCPNFSVVSADFMLTVNTSTSTELFFGVLLKQ